jgi:uncharacterized protein YndB with AHSA1/START domain
VSRYEFLTTWCIEAPRQRVWDAIYESERWPEWWPGVKATEELEPGDERGVGRLGRYEWRSGLPYDLTFEVRSTRVEAPWLLEGEASGELSGLGRWRLFAEPEQGVTAVVYEWKVTAAKPWMSRLGPLARPLFAWNHDHVMRGGGRGLARLLEARLLASS